MNAFQGVGAEFVATKTVVSAKLAAVKALILDWDGVFNDGRKGGVAGSGFSEVDSMGLNMLRYALWRRDRQVGVTAIVSGEENRTAVDFAEREHVQAVYLRVPDKRMALHHLCQTHGVASDQVALVFDDVNDLGIAAECGLRCLVRHPASPLLRDYVARRELCEYITANDASRHAVREIAEMLLGLMGVYDDVITSRAAFDAEYRAFFAARQRCSTEQYRADGTGIIAAPAVTGPVDDPQVIM